MLKPSIEEYRLRAVKSLDSSGCILLINSNLFHSTTHGKIVTYFDILLNYTRVKL